MTGPLYPVKLFIKNTVARNAIYIKKDMEFKDIKQWSVQKGIATPVNPHDQQWFDFNKQKIDYRTDHAKFEQFASQHIYATDAEQGVYGAERFGPVELQRRSIMGVWTKATKNKAGYEYRNFLRFIYRPEILEHPAEIKPEFGELKHYKAILCRIRSSRSGY